MTAALAPRPLAETRQAPGNTEAEQALLGAMLVNNAAYHRVAEFLLPEHFGNAVHGRIYAAIGKLIERGQEARPLSLSAYLDSDPALTALGSHAYLGRLVAGAVTIINVPHYAAQIVDLAQRRALIELAEQLIEDAAAVDIDRDAGAVAAEHAARFAEVARTAAQPARPIDPASLAEAPVPAREWLVPDWVPMSRVTALYGAGGEGKTLLAQQLATAAAIGKSWLGLTVRPCRSLLLFSEDDADEMQRRQADINAHYGCDFRDLGAMRWLPRLGHDNALATFGDGGLRTTPFLGQLLGEARRHGAKLIILDTLADVFSGNENDRSQARAFAQSVLGYLAREIQGAVVVLAHPSRSGLNSGSGESGSTAWIGTFRSQLYLSRPTTEEGEPPNPDIRLLARRKSNAARRDETIEVRWRAGVFVPTQPASGVVASIERRHCDRVFLDLLDRLAAEGQHVSHNSRTGNYAPRLFSLRPDRERFGKADFERAMQTLFSAGQIAVGSYRGENRHVHECIVRTTGS